MYWYKEDIERLENIPVESTHLKKIVFYGSSTFTLWENLGHDFPDFHAVNLAFGGSTLAACTWFFERVIPRQKPYAMVIYAGDNDLGDGRSPEEVVLFYYQMIANIRESLGKIPVFFISIKLSPARNHLRGSIEYTNLCIRENIEKSNDNIFYIDLFHKMLDANNEINPIHYSSDGLHLSDVGYELWKTEINQHLLKLLEI